MPELRRFVDAQTTDYAQAKKEIAAGQKTSHWIWYIFPQLKELGYSSTAKFYGIVDFNEACDYLSHPALFKNYNEMITLVEQQLSKKPTASLTHLMGGQVDANKLVSSLTLFRSAAAFLEAQPGRPQHDFKEIKERCDNIFSIIATQGYSPCPTTLTYLPSGLEPQKKKTPVQRNTLFSTPTPPVQPTSIEAAAIRTQTSSPLLPYLKDYIQTRPNEWSYHYNFLGLVALTYFILDAVLGTDYFHIKNSEVKVHAATKLMHLLDPQYKGSIEPFTKAEQAALGEGRLGARVAEQGGLQHLIQNAPTHQFEEPDSEINLRAQ
ncbi:DUF1810 domain-containing protein [Legionella fallonii]|uniref:DUF1810 domain-containing protein n=1 Tax=Legionella fallonii LLAP-10 TaxID=1212491 RepID=A0A098GBE7_9GAMM|nr:DUF1810 family protein [Legionella fallonii]CEG58801.1 conserved protein of unknown function [Legionella fallonii LLAP-10]